MTVALTVLAGALAAGWFAPGILARCDLRRRDPVPLIVAWLVSMAGVLLTVVAGVVLLVVPGHGPGVPLVAVVHRCWSAIQHGAPLRSEELTGLLGVTLLLAFAIWLAVVSVRGVRGRGRARAEHLSVLRLAARSEAGPPDTLWLAHDQPLAFSMTGHPHVVVATEGLVRHLRHDAVEAVFAHERAHLTGRHHRLVAAADALRDALPFVPLMRQAPHAIRELVELAADVTAVRKCGTTAVRTALLAVSRHRAPRTSLAIAADAVDLRLARLRQDPPLPGTIRRAISCGAAGLTAAVLPFFLGTGLLLALTLFTCPVGA